MRIDFETLAPPVRAAVENHTGPVHAFRCATSGVNSQLAGVLDTEGGRVFLKGIPEADPETVGLQREADVNPHVRDVSPRMFWHETAGGWHLAAFEVVEGRHADYSPGSPDLPKIAATLDALARVPCPPVPMFSAWRRWGRYLDDGDDAQLFAGDSLLHADPNPSNYLITDGRAWLVDWAWATRGAAFIDVALYVPRLIDSGHSPAEAEEWAGKHVVWQDTDPGAVSLFAQAIARQRQAFADQHPGDEWRHQMADAALSWVRHRTVESIEAAS